VSGGDGHGNLPAAHQSWIAVRVADPRAENQNTFAGPLLVTNGGGILPLKDNWPEKEIFSGAQGRRHVSRARAAKQTGLTLAVCLLFWGGVFFRACSLLFRFLYRTRSNPGLIYERGTMVMPTWHGVTSVTDTGTF
jgi:hypothetical protein